MAMRNRYNRRTTIYYDDDDDNIIGIAHGLTVYVGLTQARPKLLAHALHTPAANGAAGVTSYQSALPRFVRFSESCHLSSRARSRIHSSR